MGGLVIEAIVHGLPTPKVKFYKDGHLLHARKNKIEFFLGTSFLEDREIFQCLLVRPDASATGVYTILAESKAGKKRYDHHVDFVTKYPLIHLPGMHHADKKLEDFVEKMLEKIPKQPEQPAVEGEAPAAEPVPEAEKGEKDVAEKETVKDENQARAEVPDTPKVEEIIEALQVVADGEAPKVEGEEPKAEEPKKHHHHKSKSKHRAKKASSPKINSDLVDDGEEEPSAAQEEEVAPVPFKRKFSTVVHEPYEEETFRIYNSKGYLTFSGKLRDQTVIEGSNIKMLCAVTGPLPIMKWFKNGKPVPWSGTVRNLTQDGLGQVIIEKISRTDAAVYSCTAKNQFNEVTTEAVIKVIPRFTVPKSDSSKPAFTRVLGELYRTTEDDLVLEAHVRGVPDPKVLWLRDGVELNAAMDERYDFSTDHDGGYFLRIHKPSAADSALYACEAVNNEGKAKITHKVNFTELERHTHPQFVYHKESFWQPTLRMSIEPEPVKEPSEPAPEFTRAASQTATGETNVPASQNSGNDGQEPTENEDSSAGEAPAGGSGSGGDGNEDGDEGKEIPKSSTDAPDDTEEEEEKEEKKPEKRPKSSRRKRYEGPVETLLIRDSVIEEFI